MHTYIPAIQKPNLVPPCLNMLLCMSKSTPYHDSVHDIVPVIECICPMISIFELEG